VFGAVCPPSGFGFGALACSHPFSVATDVCPPVVVVVVAVVPAALLLSPLPHAVQQARTKTPMRTRAATGGGS
jgi:hypothetical protein